MTFQYTLPMLHFAVAGVPHSTPPPRGTCEGMRHAHALGITAMELEWVQRVPMNTARMQDIRRCSEELGGMSLTVHAPYYINLNAADESKLEASKRRIIDALSMAEIAGARSVCVHPAFYLRMDPLLVYDRVRRATEDILSHKQTCFPSVNLAYETMGKHSQFGTFEEVLKLSAEFGIYPTVDFAHMHARANGAINSTKEWDALLDSYVSYLGRDSLKSMHIHYSGINYNGTGERNHLPLLESDANWKDFLAVLKRRGVAGQLVCESPILEQDTLLMQSEYHQL